MKHCFLLPFLFFLFYLLPIHAQLRVYPFMHPQVQTTPAARVQAEPLPLPFFDDFSLYGEIPTAPRSDHWIPGGGAIIGNNFAQGHASKGVAVLDGLTGYGKPYGKDLNIYRAPVDTLTSVQIQLAGVTPADSAGMHFRWNNATLGELPDPKDSLVLEWKDHTGQWKQAWAATGVNNPVISQWKDTLLLFPASCLHAQFQFRFRAYGHPHGTYDAWVIDYIIIQKNITAVAASIRDLAPTQMSTPLLKRYASMPWVQFQGYETREWATQNTVIGFLYNTHPGTRGKQGLEYRHDIYQFRAGKDILLDPTTDTTRARTGTGWISYYLTQNRTDSAAVVLRNKQDVQIPIPLRPYPTLLRPVSEPAPVLLKAVVQVRPTASAGQSNPQNSVDSLHAKQNDALTRTTVLHNYYAYDDGTPEMGAGLNSSSGKIAVRYILNKPDTLTAIDIAFSHNSYFNQAGQPITLIIWKRLDGKPGSVLYQKTVPMHYGTTDAYGKVTSVFTRYPPANERGTLALVVSDTIYIGWQQFTSDLVTIGYDRNSPFGTEHVYDLYGNNVWNSPPQNIEKGSFLIRPVFEEGNSQTRPDLTGGIRTSPATDPTAPLTLYPNPNTGVIYWNRTDIEQIEVSNLLGRVLSRHRLTTTAPRQLNLSALPNGVYLLRLHQAGTVTTRKIVLNR